MDIDLSSLEIAKYLYNQHEEVRTLEKEDLSLFLNNIEICNNDNISLIMDIVCAIKSAQELAFDSDYDKILAYLYSSSLSFESKYYLAYILVSDYSINPFGVLSSINTKDLYFGVHHFFESTFEICPLTNIRIITIYLEKVFDLTKNDGIRGQVIDKFDKYLKKDFQMNVVILELFHNTPEEYLLWVSVFALENIFTIDLDDFNCWIDTFLESKIELHQCCATICCKNIMSSNFEFSISKIDKIYLKCQNVQNERLIGNAMQLFYQLLECDSVSDEMTQDLQTIILTNIKKSDIYKYCVAGELSHSTCLNDFKKTLLYELFSTQIGENLGLIRELDHIAYYLIKSGHFSIIWELLKKFYVVNSSKMMTTEFSEYFDLTFHVILDKHSDYIVPELYKCLLSTFVEIKFAIHFFNMIAFNKTYMNISWIQDIDASNALIIIKLLTVNCFEANFICFISLKILEITLSESIFELYKLFYLQSIFMNYPELSYKSSIEYPSPNSQQKALIENITVYHEKIEAQNKLIKGIKDLEPSQQRIMQYRIEQQKSNEMSMEKSQEKSVFASIVNRSNIKYGVRYGLIRNDKSEGDYSITESSYSSFKYPYSLPFKYITDPLALYVESIDIHTREGG